MSSGRAQEVVFQQIVGWYPTGRTEIKFAKVLITFISSCIYSFCRTLSRSFSVGRCDRIFWVRMWYLIFLGLYVKTDLYAIVPLS